jgi:cellulose synthase/poly-beta-1,6-N-acetylglucosamine synthase-like glycosyltransferase
MPRLASTSPNLTDVAPEDGVPVSVIIPARNESAQIETVVRSVLASTYQPLEVLVVDDRSTDDTAARVKAMARDDARLRLVRGEPLPAGWYGKPWACRQGAGLPRATSSYSPTPTHARSCAAGCTPSRCCAVNGPTC